MATAKKREEARTKAAEHTVLLQFTMGNLRAAFGRELVASERMMQFVHNSQSNRTVTMANEIVVHQSELRASYTLLRGSYEALLADLPNVPEALTFPVAKKEGPESDDDKAKAKAEAASEKDKAAALDLLKHRYEDGLDDANHRFMRVNCELIEALANATTLPATNPVVHHNNPGGDPHGHNNVGVDKVAWQLKPFTLGRENSPTELADWLERFRDFYNASSLGAKDIPGQQSYWKSFIKPPLYAQIKAYIIAETPIYAVPPLDSCTAFLQAEFLRHYPLTVRRLDFFRLTQSKGQLYTDFYAKLAASGELADLAGIGIDDLLVFRVLVGIHDDRLRQLLLRLPELTLAEVTRESRAYESASTTTRHVDGASHAGKGSSEAKATSSSKGSKGEGKSSKACGWCGGGHPFTKERKGTCPAFEATCKNCGKVGHYAKQCRASKSGDKKQKSGDKPSGQGNSGSKTNVVRILNSVSRGLGNRPTPLITMTFQDEHGNHGFDHDILPDTGATRTIISHDLVKKSGITTMRKTDELLYDASKNRMKVEGRIWILVRYEHTGESLLADALVTSSMKEEILISWHDMDALGVAKLNLANMATGDHAELDQKMETVKESYQDILSDKLAEKPMEGPPMTIHMKPDAIPKKIWTAKQPPLHYMEMAEQLVNDSVRDGVFRRVPTTESTDWIARGLFVLKPNGKSLRLVVDFSELNKCLVRPVHGFVSGKELLRRIKRESVLFCKLDATQGYFQVPMDKQSQELCTFLLWNGRYQFLRAPMGLSASSDEWCNRSDAAIHGLPGVLKLVDDILVQASSEDELLERVTAVLDRCRKHNMILSLKKMEYGASVTFAGFLIGKDGIKPDPEMTLAIADFPAPVDVTSTRSFLGLAQQLAWFIPDLAHITDPLRKLLCKGVSFQWLEGHQEAFQMAKKVLTSSLLVKHFDPTLPTELVTDASRTGLGFALIQRDADSHVRLIQAGSRSLCPAETRYAVSELECLAIYFAVTKCRHYLLGARFKVVTDHRPLEGVFRKHLDDLSNARLRRYCEKLMPYSFSVQWVAGKTHLIADALSRFPVFPPPEAEEDIEDAEIAAGAAMCHAISTDPNLSPLFEAAAIDHDYEAVKQALLDGRVPKQFPPAHPARQYSSVWSDLSVYDDGLIVLDGSRIVIPETERGRILELLHLPHNGQTKTKVAARQLYYWPTMNNEITLMVERCEPCRHFLPSIGDEPLILTEASGPMAKVGSDLFQLDGKNYLVVKCSYSGWIWMAELKSTVTSSITSRMTSWFNTFGWPAVIRTDGGPQFRTEFSDFCEKHGISRDDGPSSPYNPQSNGLAESGVKQVKHLLAKCKVTGQDFGSAFLEYQNAPRADGVSAAQLFFNRRLRSSLPTLPTADAVGLSSNSVSDRFQEARQASKQKVKDDHDKTAHHLPELNVGQQVELQNPKTLRWGDETGVIGSIRNNGRSYDVTLDKDQGNKVRNRRFLRPRPEMSIQVPKVNEQIPESADSGSFPDACSTGTKKKKTQLQVQGVPVKRRSARYKSKPVRYND
jgi:hypothetical protein